MSKKLKKICLLVLTLFLVVGGGVTVANALGNYNLYKIANKSYEDLGDLETVDLDTDECPSSDASVIDLNSSVVAPVPNPVEQMQAEQADLISKGVSNPNYATQYDKMKMINQDYVAWIKIPGTVIDYPICYDGNNEYYLHHDFYGNDSINGCLFVDRRDNCPFYDKSTIVYGHHMRNGTMFGGLSKMLDENYLNNHSVIKIALRDRVMTYDVFSVFSEELCEQSYTTEFSTLGSFVEHCNYLKGKSMVNTNVGDFKISDRILVLSTCSYETDHSRLLVCAKLRR